MNSYDSGVFTQRLIVPATTQSASCLRCARNRASLLMGITLAALSGALMAQAATVTATKGQSPQQIEADKQQCYGSAVQSSGYDPASSHPATGGRARGAAVGAAAGTAAAEVRGRQYDAYDRVDDDVKREYRQRDAKSAAAAGAVVGGTAQRRERRETAADAQAFDNAYRSCLTARGYAVQ